MANCSSSAGQSHRRQARRHCACRLRLPCGHIASITASPRYMPHARAIHRTRCHRRRDHRAGRQEDRARLATRLGQGEPRRQRAVPPRDEGPVAPSPHFHRPDAGGARRQERPRTALHRPDLAAPVRRLPAARLCRRDAQECPAAQCPRRRVLLPRRPLAEQCHGAAQLHLRQLHPCRGVPAGPRRQRHRPAGRQKELRRRSALQPQLQHRPDARASARAARGPGEFRAGGAGQFRTAVHAGRGRSRRRRRSATSSTAP